METPERQNSGTSERQDAETPKRQSAETSSGRESVLGPGPPDDLPADPRQFWLVAADLDELEPPHEVDTTPALKKAGVLPFPRSRFPLMGFLATVYEQIANRAKEMANAAGSDPRPGASCGRSPAIHRRERDDGQGTESDADG
ncbi:MAG: hypothetical protein JXQ75_17715 [Phycisphaerae bacterium]|nr:hypothetical protein [Phycisphaerae bacterium]